MNHITYRGDTVNFRLTVTDYLGKPADITGWTFVLSAAKRMGGAIALSATGTIESATGGIVTFQLTPEQTDNTGRFFYDVQATTDLGEIHTVDSGEINIIPDITNPLSPNVPTGQFLIESTGH